MTTVKTKNATRTEQQAAMAKTAVSLPAPAERVARIAPLLTDSGAANETLGRLTPGVVDALHEQRLYRMLLPKAYGGDEVTPPEFFKAMVALATCDASTAWCIGQQNGCAMSAAYLPPEVSQEIWGKDSRAALAWGPPLKSDVAEAEGGYRISGQWSFASGVQQATWIGLQCNLPGKPTGMTRTATGMPSMTGIVPASRIDLEPAWDVLGLRATSSDGWKTNGMFVPEAYCVRRDWPGSKRIQTPLYHFPSMMLFAIGFSGVAIGAGRAMLDSFVDLAKGGKAQRGVSIPLRDNHAVQMQVAEAEARLRGAYQFVLSTTERVWQEVLDTNELTNQQRLDLRLATTHSLHEAKTAADIAWDAAGSTAIARSGAFERRFRDIHTVTQQVQGRKANLQVVGAYLLGHEPDMAWA
jgi:indole-3-acetate monooxygenase